VAEFDHQEMYNVEPFECVKGEFLFKNMKTNLKQDNLLHKNCICGKMKCYSYVSFGMKNVTCSMTKLCIFQIVWWHVSFVCGSINPVFLQEVITSYTRVSTLTALLFVNITPANGEGLLSCIESLLQHHTGTPQLYIVYCSSSYLETIMVMTYQYFGVPVIS